MRVIASTGMGVGEGTYGTYAYVSDVGLRFLRQYCHFLSQGRDILKNIQFLSAFQSQFITKCINLDEFAQF